MFLPLSSVFSIFFVFHYHFLNYKGHLFNWKSVRLVRAFLLFLSVRRINRLTNADFTNAAHYDAINSANSLSASLSMFSNAAIVSSVLPRPSSFSSE